MFISNIRDYFKAINPDDKWSFVEKTRKETRYATHGYHRYPAKFIPQIVAPLIEKFSKPGDIVVDPFAGCGTTLVESKLLNRKSYGTDVNPVACLITKAKITPIDPESIVKSYNKLKNSLVLYDESHVEIPSMLNEKLRYWFKDQEIKKLTFLFKQIEDIKDTQIKNFFYCAFSNILKNCSIWLQSSNKPQRDPKKVPADPFKMMERQISVMNKGNTEFYDLLKERDLLHNFCKIYRKDARDNPLEEGSVDLVVTSPPYVTSYEYADFHQLTGYWFDYIKDLSKFRKKFIGTVYKTKKNINLHSSLATQIVNQLKAVDRKMSEEVSIYFSDMFQVFKEMKRILKPGGTMAIVIGNTQFKNIEVLNAEVFVEQLQELGFYTYEIIKRQVPAKNLPSIRDKKTGRFAKLSDSNKTYAYAVEYILIVKKTNSN